LVVGRLGGKKVLDIGCATGWVAYRAIKEGADALATDIFGTHVNSSIPFQLCDKEEMPFPDKSFDMVLTANVLHHGNLTKTTEEIYRVLKEGGEFVSFQEPCILNQIDEQIYLQKFLKKELDLGLDEHRPNLLDYLGAFRAFKETEVYEMRDKIFQEPISRQLVKIIGNNFDGGIAIRAVK
jgi:ubiquinone/menaquinone biosynthesis C-methylase UbiE